MDSQNCAIRTLLSEIGPRRAENYIRAFDLRDDEAAYIIERKVYRKSIQEIAEAHNVSQEMVKQRKRDGFFNFRADALILLRPYWNFRGRGNVKGLPFLRAVRGNTEERENKDGDGMAENAGGPAPVMDNCAAVGGYAALRMRRPPCGDCAATPFPDR